MYVCLPFDLHSSQQPGFSLLVIVMDLSGSVAGGVLLPPPICACSGKAVAPHSLLQSAWILGDVFFDLYNFITYYDYSGMVPCREKRRFRREHGAVSEHPFNNLLLRCTFLDCCGLPIGLGAGVCCCCLPVGLQGLRCQSADPTPSTSTSAPMYGFDSHQNVAMSLVRGLFRFFTMVLCLWFFASWYVVCCCCC